MARLRFVNCLDVGDGRLAAGAPVDHVVAAIDQTGFPHPNERLAHGARQAGIHREAFARPIDARAFTPDLVLDTAAVFFFPLPHAALELFASQLDPLQTLLRELPLHNHLCCDAGMVHARKPQCRLAFHAMPADGHIHYGMVEHVTDMQRTSYVRWRNDQRKNGTAGYDVGAVQSVIHPPLRPMRLKTLWFIHFFELHPETSE